MLERHGIKPHATKQAATVLVLAGMFIVALTAPQTLRGACFGLMAFPIGLAAMNVGFLFSMNPSS